MPLWTKKRLLASVFGRIDTKLQSVDECGEPPIHASALFALTTMRITWLVNEWVRK